MAKLLKTAGLIAAIALASTLLLSFAVFRLFNAPDAAFWLLAIASFAGANTMVLRWMPPAPDATVRTTAYAGGIFSAVIGAFLLAVLMPSASPPPAPGSSIGQIAAPDPREYIAPGDVPVEDATAPADGMMPPADAPVDGTAAPDGEFLNARPSELPAFPTWPPPQPSARLQLQRRAFAVAQTLGDVGTLLTLALRKGKYWEYSFYRLEGGFAVVTQLERINSDGSVADDDLRFLPPDREPFSLETYVTRLFFAPEGDYRLIVFIVTDKPYAATSPALSQKQAETLLARGGNQLSADYEAESFTKHHTIDALIYQFHKKPDDKAVAQVIPSPLSALNHLEKAGLAPALGLPPS